MEQVKKLRDEAHAKEMAAEADPDTRAWLQGWHECTSIPSLSQEHVAKVEPCLGANEAKSVASLKAQAASEKAPAAKEAFRRAAECIERAPRVNSTAKMYGQYDEVKACLHEKRRALSREAQAKDDDFALAEKEGTADGWLAFLAKHREDERAPEAARRVAAAAAHAEGDARIAIEEKLANVYPPGVAELPAERRILLVGPKGLRVRDLTLLNEAKVAPSIVVARVKASTDPYKSFDGEELAALKRLGISDEVVAAMIEVTAKVHERRKADEERDALRAELAALKAMIEAKKGAGGGEVVQTKDGPMDFLASCAKRLAAMKLCEQIPFPGSTICQTTAESSFPCPKQ